MLLIDRWCSWAWRHYGVVDDHTASKSSGEAGGEWWSWMNGSMGWRVQNLQNQPHLNELNRSWPAGASPHPLPLTSRESSEPKKTEKSIQHEINLNKKGNRCSIWNILLKWWCSSAGFATVALFQDLPPATPKLELITIMLLTWAKTSSRSIWIFEIHHQRRSPLTRRVSHYGRLAVGYHPVPVVWRFVPIELGVESKKPPTHNASTTTLLSFFIIRFKRVFGVNNGNSIPPHTIPTPALPLHTCTVGTCHRID